MSDYIDSFGKTGPLENSLSGLIKFNYGLFKSNKQRVFIRNQLTPMSSEVSMFCYGIPLEGDQMITVTTRTTKSQTGKLKVFTLSWLYVVDLEGVVAKYKLEHEFSVVGMATTTDPTKTKLIWKR